MDKRQREKGQTITDKRQRENTCENIKTDKFPCRKEVLYLPMQPHLSPQHNYFSV